jgi:hypothetical protein
MTLAVAGCGNGTPASPSSPATSASQSAATSPAPASGPAEVSSPSAAFAPTPTPASPSPTAGGIPNFKHVYLIVMENREYGSIVGAAAAPYLNSLIARYGLATAFYAETHPSQPNYVAMTSGGLQGTTTDGTYNLAAPNLFDQIESSGRTWRVYAQGYPGGCYKPYIADAVTDGPGASGEYVRKHNPAISYTSISGDPPRCANITTLAGFDPAAADFEMIIPNQINDMHSSSVGAGDRFLEQFVPLITGSAAFADSVLFITWDEGISSNRGGGHIATIVAAPGMPAGSRYTADCNHYSLLRTIQDAWGLAPLGEAANAAPLAFQY